LIAKGKLAEARKIFESFGSANGIAVDSTLLASTVRDIKNTESDIQSSAQKNMTGILDLIRTPKMRKRTLVLAYNWLV
jgi:OCT family organic cation transporter-like MFS transporter 4/5